MTETASSPTRRVMHELKFRQIEVTALEPVTDRYLRVTFGGDDLADFTSLDPDDHMKLVFFADPDGDPVLPTRGEKGWVYPEGAVRPSMRDYTPRRFDQGKRELEVEFVIHGEGPASSWAAQAKVGQRLAVVGPRGSHIVDYVFDWYLLIGDETTWPSIARRLEEFPAGAKVHVFVEIDSPADEFTWQSDADVTVQWVYRHGAAAGTTDVLEQAIRAADLPAGNAYVWAGGEATGLRGIRRYLKDEVGMPVSNLSFSGHWKYGVADHDHHEPIED